MTIDVDALQALESDEEIALGDCVWTCAFTCGFTCGFTGNEA